MPAALTVLPSDMWRTPPEIVALVASVNGGGIDLDPCGHPESQVGARRQFLLCAGEDGLVLPWGRDFCFVNPPYSRGHLSAWMRRCREQADFGAEVVALVPSDTSTAWWHRGVRSADAFCLLQGRLQFVGAPQGAKFGSALVYFGRLPEDFRDAVRRDGWVFILRRRAS